jgi:hypothetical protein
MHPTKIIAPPPPEFRQQFIIGGWRRVERIYGARTDTIRKWIDMLGGLAALQAERAAVKQAA